MSKGESIFPNSFILRITKEEWARQVFKIKRYFPGVPRSWEPKGTIILARKSENKDSFIGYGVIGKFMKRDQLPEEEKLECERMGWKGAIIFSELFSFEPPLPIKETFLGGSNVRGRCLHGYPLTQKQVNAILNLAKEKCAFHKID